ncbi:MAG: DUF2333 family protein [Proteobacteria bacterium]|nr:DUF2333 family protein [Pseudomonadota bacterium]
MDNYYSAGPAESPEYIGAAAPDAEEQKRGRLSRIVRPFGRFFARRGLAGWLWRGLLLSVFFLLIYYPLGMVLTHEIDDDLDFTVTNPGEGSSRAVAIAAALIGREVDQHGWRANDPFFLPSSLLDNMPNYQQGMISALARFAFELTDQIGRTRGSSQADPDLQEASGLLQYSGTKWVFDLSTSLAPTATSEAQYRKAMRALLSYNARLASGDAVFERRADNLLATLDRMAADLGSSSAVLEHRLDAGRALFDRQADDVFYGVKGRLYAYYLLLRELGRDFDSVIADRDLGPAWDQMLDSIAQAAALRPWVVINGSPDSQFFASHLAAQGFFLLRARTQLREITNILLK